MASLRLVLSLAIALASMLMPVYCQINMPCTSSMVSSFTPCLNFLTNSTTNSANTPTSDCCNAMKSLTSSGTDCLCLIVTGNVPFQIPINRTLAISLPRACKMPGVPLQCKAAAAPVPQPGPAALGPSLSPETAPTSSPGSKIPETLSPTLAPESDTTPALTPPTTTNPTSNPGSRPVLTPSAATATFAYSPFLALLPVLAATLIKYYY